MKLKKWLNNNKTIQKLLKNKALMAALQLLAVPILGFVLLNIAFMLDFIFQSALRAIINLFVPLSPDTAVGFIPYSLHFSFMIAILIISWFIFRSKLGTLLKAVYMVVPLATVFATIGILFYPLQIVVLTLGGLFFLGLLYYLYKTKQPWLYYYALAFIGVLMLLVAITGVDI
jgi:hypothetical protein